MYGEGRGMCVLMGWSEECIDMYMCVCVCVFRLGRYER